MTSVLGNTVSATLITGIIDTRGAIANAVGTILGGLFLTILYFTLGQKILRLPRVSGTWLLESTVLQTKYNPFRGMTLRYKILFLQSGADLCGTAEKVYEKSDKEREFTGTARATATLQGTVQKAYFGRSKIFLHIAEKGEARAFSWIVHARCMHFGTRMQLHGSFSSTAGDASGGVTLVRIPLPNHVDEYSGVPLAWFGRLIEKTTGYAYGAEWNELRQKLDSVAMRAEELWKTHNCHLLVAALTIAEDRRFNAHGGADPIAMLRALIRTFINSHIQGGSTIEQQLVRLLTADHRLSLRRKVKEIVLAVRVHRVLRKDQVPVAYLASAYYGWHMNGVLEAAHRLAINLKNPSAKDAARLIACIRYPRPRYDRHRDESLRSRRQEWLVRELERRTYLFY